MWLTTFNQSGLFVYDIGSYGETKSLNIFLLSFIFTLAHLWITFESQLNFASTQFFAAPLWTQLLIKTGECLLNEPSTN